MNTEDPIRHNGSHWHAVIAVHKAPPQLNAIPSLALVEKPIDPIDIRRFVVSAQQKEGLRIAELVRQQQGQGFYRVQTPIHVIPEKEVVGSRWYAALLKDPQQVLKLTVQIPADLHRSTEFQEHRLGQEQLPTRTAYVGQGGLGQVTRPPVPEGLGLQLGDDGVQVGQSVLLVLVHAALGRLLSAV